jgi:Concanavalin A-like lectin/glucanases superfamily/Calcineurin-like phosphoesterase
MGQQGIAIESRARSIALAGLLAGAGCSSGDDAQQPGGTSTGVGTATAATLADTGSSSDADETIGGSEDDPEPDAGVPITPTCDDPDGHGSLEVLGAGEGVHVGDVAALGLSIFTVEAWIRWDGYGTPASSGVGGVVAEPIVSKGRGESDGGNIDCNWFLGIDAAGRLVADFEDMETGLNHPASSLQSIERGAWHHVAASFDGTDWRLFVDGMLDATVPAPAMPRADSIQHVGIGGAYDSLGTRDGSFDGRIDEVRVWSRTLAELELQAGMFEAPPNTDGLVAHWPLDEAAGTTVDELVGGYVGEREGTAWLAEGRPQRASTPPAPPIGIAPGETVDAGTAVLQASIFDVDGDELRVELWGRALPEVEPFSIAVLPDTQYFCEQTNGGNEQMFYDQTQWLADNAETYGLRAVLHVGDLVDNGESHVSEWMIGQAALETLEEPLPDHPEGIPYGVAVGNHDQRTNSYAGQTGFYNQYFGSDRFAGRTYYGGHFGETNDASYITFSAGELDFLAIFFEYDQPGIPEENTGPDPEVLAWARRVVAEHPDHYVVAVGHSCLVGTGDGAAKVGTPFSPQGQTRYQALRGEPNLRMMVCGHVEDEGRRTDVAASTVHTVLSDYQFDDHGGSGKLRLMTFRPELGEVEVQTYSPYYDQWYETGDAHFTLPVELDRGAGEFELVGTVEHAQPGQTVAVAWGDLQPGMRYEWFARTSDCTHVVDGERRIFTAQ